MDPVTAARQATASLSATIKSISPAQLTAASPCPDFDARGVVNHMIGGSNMFAGVLGGTPAGEAAEDADAAALGSAYDASAAALIAAASAEGALEKTVNLGPMELPGSAAASLIVADHIVHAWDLAKATGSEHGVSDEMAEWALGAWQQMLAPQMRDGNMFGPEQPCADDAPLMDRVAAFTGRTV